MDISKQNILDLLYDSDALTLGLVEILGPGAIDFNMEDLFKENHVAYMDAIECAIERGSCVRIYRPELVSKKFKEYQTSLDVDGLATKITLHPAGFNIKNDYCPWYNFWEYIVSGEKTLVKNKKVVKLTTGMSHDILAHEGELVTSSIADTNTVTYCVYRNRLFYQTGPFYNISMEGHPFFKRK